MENKTILNTLLNLTNIIIEQQTTINKLNGEICDINKKLDLILNSTKQIEDSQINSNIKFTRTTFRQKLIEKLKELHCKVISPTGRTQPYIILNDNIKINYAISKINDSNMVDVHLNNHNICDFDYFIIGCINYNNDCDYVIIPSTKLQEIYNINNGSKRFQMKLFGEQLIEIRSNIPVNKQLNNFNDIRGDMNEVIN